MSYSIARFVLIAVASAGLTAKAAADSSPNPARQETYTSVVPTLSALTTSANDLVQLERSVGRLELIRKTLTANFVIAANAWIAAKDKKTDPKTTISLSQLDREQLLCDFRSEVEAVVEKGKLAQQDKTASITVDNLPTVARYNYLNSVVSQIQSVSKAAAPPTDLLTALQALFASYQVKASDAALNSKALEKLRTNTHAPCVADLRDFAVAYYGQSPLAPMAGAPTANVSLLDLVPDVGPIGTLVGTIISIITPVAIDLSTAVDQTKRKQAVLDFLGKEENYLAILHSGTALAQAVSDYTLAKRLITAGTFAENIAVVTTTNVDLAKLDACSDTVHLLDTLDGAPGPTLMSCYHAVWSKYQDAVSAALKAASDYDTLADAGDTQTVLKNFKEITNPANYNKMLQNSDLTNPTQFWQDVTQLVTFANAVVTAASPANRAKIQQEIDALVKSH